MIERLPHKNPSAAPPWWPAASSWPSFSSGKPPSQLTRTPPYLLPAPSRVLQTLFAHPRPVRGGSGYHPGRSPGRAGAGRTAGVLIATLLTLRPGLEDGVMTLAILFKSTPMVAIAPLLTLWLGFGVLPKIIITALLTFFPALVNVLTGLQRPDPILLDLFRSWRATRWETFIHLRAPSALPYLFAALKISAPLSLIGAVVAEWTGASGGLGRTMWLAYSNLNLPYHVRGHFPAGRGRDDPLPAGGSAGKEGIFWQGSMVEEKC